MIKVLITGANGQLGHEFRDIETSYPDITFTYSDLPEVNITHIGSLEAYVKKIQPDYIINCAAYTAVDKAESDLENAELVNVQGPKNLAEVCKKFGARLIHISTDFVFDGKGNLPYEETDEPNPNSVYGHTKLNGEEAVFYTDQNSIVIRTSWLYSVFGNNFVKTMRKLGQDKESLKVIYDQVGSPTWAQDLALAIMSVIHSCNEGLVVQGVFHYSNEGVASWYDFAKEIMAGSHISCTIHPVLTNEFPTAATRPHYSVMNKAKIKNTFGITIPHWKESLTSCIKKFT